MLQDFGQFFFAHTWFLLQNCPHVAIDGQMSAYFGLSTHPENKLFRIQIILLPECFIVDQRLNLILQRQFTTTKRWLFFNFCFIMFGLHNHDVIDFMD